MEQIIKVSGPDGKVYGFPAGTDQEQINQVMSQAYTQEAPAPQAPKQEPAPWYEQAADYIGGGARKIQDGIFYGMADELHGAVTAIPRAAYNAYQGQPFDIGQGYEEGRDDWRTKSKAFQQNNPVTGIALEVGGSIANPLNRAVGSYVGQGANMLARAGRGAFTGAGMGAAYGAGNAEGGAVDRLEGAGRGAAVGGVVGGVATPAVELVGKGAQVVADQTINRFGQGPQRAATRKIIEALQADGLTPDQAVARVNQLGPQAALMDAGPNAQALARAVYTQPGQGKTVVGDFLRTRQEGTRAADATLQGGQINRVTQSIDDLIPGNARDVRQGVQSARKAFGKSYEAAKNQTDDLVDVLPVVKSLDDEIDVSKGGIKSALERVKTFLVDKNGNPEISVDSLHQAKMAIDDLMSGEARMSMGNVAKSRIRSYQDKLVDAIESAGEAGRMYREARRGTAAAWRINDALDTGEQFMLKRAFPSADDMADAIKSMRPEEVDAFRTGAAQALKSKLGDMNTRTDVTKKLMDIPNLEQKIKAAFGDNATFKKYIDKLTAERQMFDTYGRIMGGSRTGEVTAEQAALNGGEFIQGARQLASPTGALEMFQGAMNMARSIGGRATTPEPVRRAMADALVGQTLPVSAQRTDPATLKMIRALSGPQAALAGNGR